MSLPARVEARPAVIRNRKLTHPSTRADADLFENLESRSAIVLILPHGYRAESVLADVVRAAEAAVQSHEGSKIGE